MTRGRVLIILSLIVLLLSACAAGQDDRNPETGVDAPGTSMMEGGHMDEGHMAVDSHDHTAGDHMTGPHAIPEEAAGVQNPIPLSEASITAGSTVYATHCGVCHGENGRGDGPTAASLAMSPADLHDSHVQDLTDGALFYVITKGRSGTPMPAWEEVLDEDQRWKVVNYLRTFHER